MTRGGDEEKGKFRVVSVEGVVPAHENKPFRAGDHVIRKGREWIVRFCYETKKGWFLKIFDPETKHVLEGVKVSEVDIIWPNSETSAPKL